MRRIRAKPPRCSTGYPAPSMNPEACHTTLEPYHPAAGCGRGKLIPYVPAHLQGGKSRRRRRRNTGGGGQVEPTEPGRIAAEAQVLAQVVPGTGGNRARCAGISTLRPWRPNQQFAGRVGEGRRWESARAADQLAKQCQLLRSSHRGKAVLAGSVARRLPTRRGDNQ